MKKIGFIITILYLSVNACKSQKLNCINEGNPDSGDTLIYSFSMDSIDGVVFNSKYYSNMFQFVDSTIKAEFWNPTCTDIELAENLINNTTLNFPYKISEYDRQYFGGKGKQNSHKYVLVRFIKFEGMLLEYLPKFKRDILYIYDSGLFATAIIDLTANKVVYSLPY